MMIWFVLVPVVWTLVAAVLSLLIGGGIRMAACPEPVGPAISDAAATDLAPATVATQLVITIAVDEPAAESAPLVREMSASAA